jgi:hemerythrin-like domain-containing protein
MSRKRFYQPYFCFMANEINPIKRSGQLAPLSREHHEALLFVWKIRQGLKNGTDIREVAQFVQWFWQNHLQEHFREEEQILAAHLPEDNEFVLRMIDEHQNIEALIHINENIPDEALLVQLADELNAHIRFEEREFFPYVEKTISVADLNRIYEQLSREKRQGTKWENEFWVKKG